MSSSSSQQPVTAQTLLTRIDTLQKQLTDQQVSLRRRNLIVVVVGVLLLGLLTGYFFFGYRQLTSLLDSKTLIEAAESTLLENLPDARRTMEKSIIDAAPKVAEMLSHNILENIPAGREALEGVIKNRVDDLLEHTATLTETEFKRIVKNNRKDFLESFKVLQNEKETAKTLTILVRVMEKEMERDILEDAKDLLHTLEDLNRNLEKIRDGRPRLTASEERMRRMLQICRRLQFQKAEER